MSQLNPSEISSVLKEKIAGLDLSADRSKPAIFSFKTLDISDGFNWLIFSPKSLIG